MSDETPIVELLGATHVKVYASGRVDGAVGEDGLDGEQCVVNNCIPQLLLREAALAIMRAWPPGSAIVGKAPRCPPGGSPFGASWAPHGGAPPLRLSASDSGGHQRPYYAGGLITALGCDYRIASEGTLEFSVNEVPIGVSFGRSTARSSSMRLVHARRLS
jgi:hypothetical protein